MIIILTETNIKSKNNFVYIYNLDQAYFYIKNNIRPISIDRNPRTNKIFFQFKKEDTVIKYQEWCGNSNS